MPGPVAKLFGRLTSRDVHPAEQFLKYAFAGGLATVVDMVLFSLLGWKVFPCLREDELIVKLLGLKIPELDAAVRTLNFGLASVGAFIVSNLVAYLANIFFVFKPGRHSRVKEVTLFYLVSITSFLLALGLGGAMINWFNAGAALAYLAKMVASVMINYVCRKYIVFKG